ncbi:SRPBCC domain-containing protein [Streptomyces sp. NPDC091212]|uniref:SRPBCC domain-containing protein n=1 Tax=Streptomyces sp. NPDC091212 TaxID=3155191 RepID=UPI00341BB3BE
MEHEVFVPVSAEALRQTLRDPARVARCVPGLQQDAEETAGPLAGRMKVRIGGHTITYRGALTLAERDGVFAAEGEGAEVRGTGSAKLTLTVRLTETPAPGATGDGGAGVGGGTGTTVAFTGGTRAEGRLAELPPEALTAAARRLLERFAAALAEESAESVESVPDERAAGGVVPSTSEASEASEASDGFEGLEDIEIPDVPDVPDIPEAPESGTVYSTGDFHLLGGPLDEPPAEAAHARRTMIGRSAEEVDHAPPRGRYAPVPAPDAVGGGATLRWIAPAAALALASAVVVGRVLRRRK